MNNISEVNSRRDEILRAIEEDQRQLRSALQDLTQSVSVKERINQHPKAWLLGAFCVGFLFGELI